MEGEGPERLETAEHEGRGYPVLGSRGSNDEEVGTARDGVRDVTSLCGVTNVCVDLWCREEGDLTGREERRTFESPGVLPGEGWVRRSRKTITRGLRTHGEDVRETLYSPRGPVPMST